MIAEAANGIDGLVVLALSLAFVFALFCLCEGLIVAGRWVRDRVHAVAQERAFRRERELAHQQDKEQWRRDWLIGSSK